MKLALRTKPASNAWNPLVEMLAEAGVTMPLDNAQALLSQATVSELPASEVLDGMGLVPVGGEV